MASSSHCRVAHDASLDPIQETPSSTQSLQPRIRGQDSFYSTTSEGSSIYNATRASHSAEDLGRNDDASNQVYEVADTELAANVAMFVSLKPDATVPHVPRLVQSANGMRPKPMSPWRRLQLLSENLATSNADWTKTGVFLSNDPIPRLDGARQRKTLSLNDVDNCLISLKWPGNLVSPADPIPPRYPPPIRQPTPPGLPSFGTQEAVCYSAQFLSHPTSLDPPNEERLRDTVHRIIPGRSGTDANRNRPYGDTLRRFFGFSPSTPSALPSTPPAVSHIGRAEDGTAVQGRFPYRQSGHGMNVARHLEDHPFHRRAIPPANADGSFSPGHILPVRESPYSKTSHNRRPSPVHPRSLRHPDCLFGSNIRLSPSTTPTIPQPAVTARPRSPPPAALVSLPSSIPTGSGTHTGPGNGVTDGPSDRSPTQTQPSLIDPMQAIPVPAAETVDQNKHRGFWNQFCCSMLDKGHQTAIQPTTTDSSSRDNEEGYFQYVSLVDTSNPNQNQPAGQRHRSRWTFTDVVTPFGALLEY